LRRQPKCLLSEGAYPYALGLETVWLGLVSLCLVPFVDVLGVTVIMTALPAMLADLYTSADAASLISTGYRIFIEPNRLVVPC
jgi:hypothetical protein